MSIILDHVSHLYNEGTAIETVALNDISLKINDGEFIGIIGHTGSGKSTLVQHLNGLMKATSGHIYWEGRDIYDEDFDMKLLRTMVGMVFQYPEHQLFEETVFKDVCFGPRNQGLNEKEATLRAFEALELVGMPRKHFYNSPFELSGGQKRRAAIAGVIAMKPSVLILDEPTAGLDPAGRDEILGMIKSVHDRRKDTIILVSHSMEDVADYADRIIVMEQGRPIMDGTPSEVFSHEAELKEIGLGVPKVTSVLRALANQGVDVDTGITTVDAAVEEIMKHFG